MFKQITVLGPGLLGASVLQAVHQQGLVGRKVAWERDPKRASLCSEQAWCDSAFTDLGQALEGADLIVIATPVDAIVELLRKISPLIQAGTLVTDTGSTKAFICEEGHQRIQNKGHFVGSHPMAGSEKSGFEYARADLLQGRTCLVTPLPQSDETATEKIVAFWEALEMQVTCLSPLAHDDAVAHISHLPQILASSLCAYLETCEPPWHRFSGSGLRDTTRIAGSPPDLWKEILLQNRTHVLQAIEGYEKSLRTLRTALFENEPTKLLKVLKQGNAYREKLDRHLENKQANR